MKKILLLILTFLPLATCSSQPHFDYNQPLPASLKKALDAHYDQVKTRVEKDHVTTIESLPAWFIKKSPQSRIEGAKKLSAGIALMSTNAFELPPKYVYIAPDYNSYLIVLKLDKVADTFGVEEAKNLLRLAKITEWCDSHPGNFFKTKQGKIALIDTEDCFGSGSTNEYEKKFMYVHKLLKMGKKPYTPQAYDYLKNKYHLYMQWPNPGFVDVMSKRKEYKKLGTTFLNQLSRLMCN